MESQIKMMQAQELERRLNEGETNQILDVRDLHEYQTVHIANATLLPLGELEDNLALVRTDRPVYIVCGSGMRAKQACNKLLALGRENLFVLDGGMKAWLASGLAVERGKGSSWSMDRQVRFTAAILILIGISLAYTVSPTWIILSAFVALGMIVSAITYTCGMAMLLSNMPWNRSCSGSCASKAKSEVSMGGK
jgi:rhodanese-related sulfurtransferase